MVDLTYLTKLINILKINEVSYFKEGDLTLEMHKHAHKLEDMQPTPRPSKIDEDSLPPDLRTDAITDVDKIMNWSASPDDDTQTEMPLTGDSVLSHGL